MAEKNKYYDGLGADCLLAEGILGYVFARPNTANQSVLCPNHRKYQNQEITVYNCRST